MRTIKYIHICIHINFSLTFILLIINDYILFFEKLFFVVKKNNFHVKISFYHYLDNKKCFIQSQTV